MNIGVYNTIVGKSGEKGWTGVDKVDRGGTDKTGEVVGTWRNNMFNGRYQYKVDEKGRVPCRQWFRQQLKEGLDGNPAGREMHCSLSAENGRDCPISLPTRHCPELSGGRLIRSMHGNAYNAHLTVKAGSSCQTLLRTYAEVRDTAIIIGANARVELWSEEGWEG